jgi:glycosyltransferase involved in cell wall biosynthesis
MIKTKIKRAKSIYNVQEIYPDLLINHQNLNSPFIINILKRLEKFIYNYSNAVTTIDDIFYSTILPRFKDPKKLHIIPNFVDTDLYRPLKNDYKLPSVFGKDNRKIKFLYAGNIGFFQDWDPILFAAKELSNENESSFQKTLESVFDNEPFKEVGFTNLIEPTFFTWFISEQNTELNKSIKEAVKTIAQYSTSTLKLHEIGDSDILKELYQSLSPRELRHALGEYYTPDWLADQTLDRVGYRGQFGAKTQ